MPKSGKVWKKGSKKFLIYKLEQVINSNWTKDYVWPGIKKKRLENKKNKILKL